MFTHLLVLVDDRPGAFHAVESTMRLGRRLGSHVTVAYTVRTPDIASSNASAPSRDGVGRGNLLFARIQRLAAGLGVPCVCRFVFGYETEGWIADIAARFSCDLIIVPAAQDRASMVRASRGGSPAHLLVRP